LKRSSNADVTSSNFLVGAGASVTASTFGVGVGITDSAGDAVEDNV
jgi:hypothetical protein